MTASSVLWKGENVMQLAQVWMRSLPMVAAVLGKKYGVKVEIGGVSAYTDGQTIHLPSLPANCDPETVMLARGFLDHESAHIRETNFSVFEGKTITPLTHAICNIIEDWRVELWLGNRYPGCKSNFEWLIHHEFDKPPKLDDNPASMILSYLLYTVRSWSVPELLIWIRPMEKQLDQNFPGLRPKVDLILAEIQTFCRNTQSALDYAEKLVALIEQEAQQEVQSDTASDGNNEPNPQGEQSVNEAEQGSDSSESMTELQGSGGGATQAMKEGLKQLLEAKADQLPKGIGEQMADELKAVQQAAGGFVMQVAVEGTRKREELPEQLTKEAARSSVALDARLSALLQSSCMKRSRPARQGRLNPGRLAQMRFEPRIFQRHEQRQGLDCSVHILLDCSGSMQRRMELALQSCFALTHALNKVAGVKVAVTAFPADKPETQTYCNAETVLPLIRMGEPLHRNLSLKARGSTPLAPALWWVMQQDVVRSENRKLILILTDGRPDSPMASVEAVKEGVKLGFEFYGIGICDTAIMDILPESNCRVIHQLDELPTAMFSMLQQALLQTT